MKLIDGVTVLIAIVFIATIVRFIVEGLKARGVIDPANAGNVQAAINFILAAGLFIGGYFGVETQVQKSIDSALGVSPLLVDAVLWVLTVLATKGVHIGLKWAGVNWLVPKG